MLSKKTMTLKFTLLQFVKFVFPCIGDDLLIPESESLPSKMITLKSSDGEVFEVEKAVALEFQSIKHIIEDESRSSVVNIPDVTGKILAMVIDYCRRQAADARANYKTIDEDLKAFDADHIGTIDDDLKAFDADFIEVDQSTLFDICLAAYHLNIKPLVDLACQTVADMIKGKTPEELRKIFNIKNNFTPEEEEQIRRDQAWALSRRCCIAIS